MIRPGPIDYEIRRVLPANLAAVEEFFIEFRRRCRLDLDPADSFAAELLVREALTNAVVHGCHADPGKQVRCVLRWRVQSRRLLIAVEDDGDGFDWREAWCNAAAPADCSGRGILMLRLYSTRVRYSARGNSVTIIKRF
jgi:anti-sigma regulatory factor (Ser/Thr protein kinase)